jgi:hypothetical protein
MNCQWERERELEVLYFLDGWINGTIITISVGVQRLRYYDSHQAS